MLLWQPVVAGVMRVVTVMGTLTQTIAMMTLMIALTQTSLCILTS